MTATIEFRPKIGSIAVVRICVVVALPFILVALTPFYYRHDIENFRLWAECLDLYGRQIYLSCEMEAPPNYPFVGLMASAGVLHAIKSIAGITDGASLDIIFRYFLAAVDVVNFVLIMAIARMMRLRYPFWIALALLVIPSNLVGGAIWGQIDNISLLFCLITTVALIKSCSAIRQNENRMGQGDWLPFGWLMLALLAMAAYLLTKQLNVFSIPYLVLFVGVIVIGFWRTWKFAGLIIAIGVVVLFGVVLFGMDQILSVASQFHGSGYYYVWTGGGSEHASKISGNGFNIWMFLGWDMRSPSMRPFSLLWDENAVLIARPYYLGIGLYLFFMLFLLITVLSMVQRLPYLSRETGFDPQPALVAVLFLYHGLSYLGFNVLLTGTHERYMYSGYRFLLLAVTWFLTRRFVVSWRYAALCFFSAIAYGFFVFSRIGPLPGVLFAFEQHQFQAALHLFLLIVLLDAWWQIWRRRDELARL